MNKVRHPGVLWRAALLLLVLAPWSAPATPPPASQPLTIRAEFERRLKDGEAIEGLVIDGAWLQVPRPPHPPPGLPPVPGLEPPPAAPAPPATAATPPQKRLALTRCRVRGGLTTGGPRSRFRSCDLSDVVVEGDVDCILTDEEPGAAADPLPPPVSSQSACFWEDVSVEGGVAISYPQRTLRERAAAPWEIHWAAVTVQRHVTVDATRPLAALTWGDVKIGGRLQLSLRSSRWARVSLTAVRVGESILVLDCGETDEAAFVTPGTSQLCFRWNWVTARKGLLFLGCRLQRLDWGSGT